VAGRGNLITVIVHFFVYKNVILEARLEVSLPAGRQGSHLNIEKLLKQVSDILWGFYRLGF